jgi:hypothetical protein
MENPPKEANKSTAEAKNPPVHRLWFAFSSAGPLKAARSTGGQSSQHLAVHPFADWTRGPGDVIWGGWGCLPYQQQPGAVHPQDPLKKLVGSHPNIWLFIHLLIGQEALVMSSEEDKAVCLTNNSLDGAPTGPPEETGGQSSQHLALHPVADLTRGPGNVIRGGWGCLPHQQQPGAVHWPLFIDTMCNLNIWFLRQELYFIEFRNRATF